MKKLQFFIVGLFILATNLNAQTQPILYSYFVAGHAYGRPGAETTGLYPPFTQKFDYIQQRPEIKFGVFTGDIVPPGPTAADWDAVDSDINALGLPVYFAVGNHDMEDRELFESRYGETYFSFRFENDLFVILDPNIDGWNISGDQLEFLKKTIETGKDNADNIFVFFHQLLWWKENSVYKDYRPNSFAGRADSINFWPEIEPLFSSLTIPVYCFAGDVGAGSWAADFMYDKYQNLSFVATGMGEGPGDNFVVVNVYEDKSVGYDLICLNDSVTNCFGSLEDHILSSRSELIESELKVKVFPNPASEKFTVEIFSPANENYKFSLYDTLGNIVVTKKIVSNNKTEIRSDLPEGIYFYRVQQNRKELQTGKIIIKN